MPHLVGHGDGGDDDGQRGAGVHARGDACVEALAVTGQGADARAALAWEE